jgi:hypothetical protein
MKGKQLPLKEADDINRAELVNYRLFQIAD